MAEAAFTQLFTQGLKTAITPSPQSGRLAAQITVAAALATGRPIAKSYVERVLTYGDAKAQAVLVDFAARRPDLVPILGAGVAPLQPPSPAPPVPVPPPLAPLPPYYAPPPTYRPPPAPPPGGPNMAGIDWGSVLTTGLQVAGQYLAGQQQVRIARYAGPTYAAPMTYAAPSAYMPASYAPGYAPALELPMGPAETSVGGALITAGGAALATAQRWLAGVTGRRVLAFIMQKGIPAAAAADLAIDLFRAGAVPSTAVYARLADNKTVGVMRGDIKALNRLKRSGPRLMRTLRKAGYGRRALPRRKGRRC